MLLFLPVRWLFLQKIIDISKRMIYIFSLLKVFQLKQKFQPKNLFRKIHHLKRVFMLNNYFRKAKHFIFFPAFILTVLLSFSGILFQFSQNSVISGVLGPAQLAILKFYSFLPQAILAITLLFFSIYKPFEKVFKGTLITLTVLLIFLTTLMFFKDQLILKNLPQNLGIYKPLLSNWIVSLLYITLSVFSFNLNSLLIWGFINRVTALYDGMKFYILLALVLGISSFGISNFAIWVIGNSKWPFMGLIIPAIGLMVGSIFIFNWFWARLPSHPVDFEKVSSWPITFPVLSAAYLLAGTHMVKSFLEILFKSGIKTQFPNPADYMQFMAKYATYFNSGMMVISIILAIIGTYMICKKSWKFVALLATISVLFGAILYFLAPLSSVANGIANGLFVSTLSVLFFPLVQILYLHLPYQKRLRTKILTEMIALPLMKAVPSISIQGLIVAMGSLAFLATYIKVIVFILIGLLLYLSLNLGKKASI